MILCRLFRVKSECLYLYEICVGFVLSLKIRFDLYVVISNPSYLFEVFAFDMVPTVMENLGI